MSSVEEWDDNDDDDDDSGDFSRAERSDQEFAILSGLMCTWSLTS